MGSRECWHRRKDFNAVTLSFPLVCFLVAHLYLGGVQIHGDDMVSA